MVIPIFLWECPGGRSFFRSFRDRWGGISRNVNNPQLKLLDNLTVLLSKLQSNSDTIRIQERFNTKFNFKKKKKNSSKGPTMSGPMSFAVAPSGATTLRRRNLSLHWKSGGASFCACIVTATISFHSTNHWRKSSNKEIIKLKKRNFFTPSTSNS